MKKRFFIIQDLSPAPTIVMDLGHVSGVIQMLVNLNQGRLGKDGAGGNALEDVAALETEGLDWVLNDALDKVRRAKSLATDIAIEGAKGPRVNTAQV